VSCRQFPLFSLFASTRSEEKANKEKCIRKLTLAGEGGGVLMVKIFFYNPGIGVEFGIKIKIGRKRS